MKVLVFGTFDIFHKGHEHFLMMARKHGSELFVVVALDETVDKLKGDMPSNCEIKRLEKIKSLSYVDHAILGNRGDKLKVVEDIKPDVICIGYDQRSFNDNLKEKLLDRGIKCEIVQFKEGLEVHRYKSSLIKKSF